MAGTIVVATVVSAIVSYTTTPVYESTAQLTFVRQPDIASALSGMTAIGSVTEAQVQAQTYAELMTSGEMRARTEKELGRAVADDVEVRAEYVPDTAVLRISVRSEDASEAQAVANAYAAAFTAWRRQVAVDQYEQAERIIQDRIRRYGSDPNRLSDPAYVQLVSRLQDIRLLKSAATGNFVVAAAAELPAQPVLPRHTRDIMLGLLIGLVLGIGAVVLLEQLDVRLHSVDEIGEALALPVLARIPRMPATVNGEAGPVTLTDPVGPNAEAYRIFRGNLEFADIDGAARTVMVTSAVQSEGKSTTASNLAVAAALSGKRVILVDADLRRSRLHRLFGLRNTTGLSTVLTGRATVEETLQSVQLPVAGAEGGAAAAGSLRVLTTGPLPPNPGEIAASQRLAEFIRTLAAEADLVVVDAPPFLVVGDAGALSRAVDGLVVVARLGTVTKAIAQDSREFLATLPCRVLGVAVVGIPTESAAYRYEYYSKDAEATGDEAAGGPASATEPEQPATA